MKKITIAAIIAISLAGCMGSGTPQSAAALDTLSATCDNPNIRSTGGLPVRCGPQVAKPYSYQ